MQFKSLFITMTLAGAVLLASVSAATAEGDSGFFLEPEAIYMSFTESNFGYAHVGPYDADEVDGVRHRVETEYEMGYRLGLGYLWANGFDFSARYTHLDAESSDSVQADGGDSLFHDLDVFFVNGYDEDAFGEAHVDQSLDYLDLTVGRTFTGADGHSARFFAGFRWAEFEQSLDVVYVDSDGNAPASDDSAFNAVRTSDYSGVGIVLGAEGHLGLGVEKDWSLFGSVAIAFLTGDTDQTHFDIDYSLDATGSSYENVGDRTEGTIVSDTSDNFDANSIVGEAQLGVEWNRDFDRVSFGLRFGVELQYWSGIGTLPTYSGDDNYSDRIDQDNDIGLKGGFLRASFGW